MQASARVLFVDDDDATRRAFVGALRRQGYVIDVAADGDEAWGQTSRNRYAAIIVDYRLPSEDGLQVVQRLHAAQPEAAFILITGHTGFQVPRDSPAWPIVSEVLYKPWSASELSEVLRRGLLRFGERSAERFVQLATQPNPGHEFTHVLVVEDNPDDARMLQRLLTQAPNPMFGMTVAPRLPDGLEYLESGKCDVILLDVSAVETGGLAAVAQIQATAPSVPIVVIGEAEDEALSHNAIRLGAQDYLSKQTLDGAALRRGLAFAVERYRARERITYLTNYDQLTGLHNASLFRDKLASRLVSADRDSERFGLMVVDVDRFRSVNETLGHDSGDTLLRSVAERLKAALPDSTVFARMSADSFAVIIEELHEAHDAAYAGRRVLRSLGRPFLVGEQEVFVTSSVGIALYPDVATVDELLKAAEEAVYTAKRSGRHQYHVQGPTGPRSSTRLFLESDLSTAVKHDEFTLRYQPKINGATGRVVGFEALLSWVHPRHGNMRPVDFIPVLEDTGLIVQVGEWVLRTACRQSVAWFNAGLPQLSMAVNVSARQLRGEDMIDTVGRALSQTGLAPHLLELELTESVLADVEPQVLENLKSLGISVSIDDFGTGYSSLTYLRKYHVDALKIDRSFVRDIVTDENDATIAGAIIGLGKSLGLDVIAEGVETLEQLDFLRKNGCELFQGYLFARPMAAADIETWMRKYRADERSNVVAFRLPRSSSGDPV